MHTHSRYATAFAAARQDISFVCNENAGPSGPDPGHQAIRGPGQYRVGGSSDRVVRSSAREPGGTTGQPRSCGHWDTVEDACVVAAQVEWAAQVACLARMLGGRVILTGDEQAWFAGNYRFTFAREFA